MTEGDTLRLRSYEQDNYCRDGVEEIESIALADDPNPDYDANPGHGVTDAVFVLSAAKSASFLYKTKSIWYKMGKTVLKGHGTRGTCMSYQRLPYEEYFINTSEDYTHTGRVSYPVKYIAVKYNTTKIGKLLGIAHEVNYEIHYEPDRDVIQIHFQRTFGMTDWIANVFEFGSRYYSAIEFEGQPLQLRVHHGWGNMYLAIKYEVREKWKKLHEIHPEAATEILGWSLGSAIACLCCQDLNYNFGIQPYLYTFGSVRPFKCTPLNRKQMQRYLATLYTDCANFADINDLITYMLPFRGFTMIRCVKVGTDLKRSFFRLIHPLRYHVHYDLPELYKKLTGKTSEGSDGGQEKVA